MEHRFPPPISVRKAFGIPEEFYDKGLPRGKEYSAVSGKSQYDDDYAEFWDHLVKNYWSELFQADQIVANNPGLTIDGNVTYGMALYYGQKKFQDLVDEFENGFLESANGIDPEKFYLRTNNKESFSSDLRLRFWDAFLRNSEIGQRRYNVFIWVWQKLFLIFQEIQKGMIHKATAQSWMNNAQKRAVERINNAAKWLKEQDDSEDFGTIHNNQSANQKIDVIKGERSNVQRTASAKSQELSSIQQKMGETNTFLKTMIEQLESALRSVAR